MRALRWFVLGLCLQLAMSCTDAGPSTRAVSEPATEVDVDAGSGPADDAIDPEKPVDLGAHDAALRAALEAWVVEEEIIGAVAVIKSADGQRWEGAVGQADRATDTASDVTFHYHVASITKHIVAAAIMSLVEDGVVDLDDPLSRHRAYPGGDSITLRMLLNHTSGVRDYQSSERFFADASANLARRWEPDEIIQYAIDDGPVFAPGEGWHYSNTGYLLLGQVIESATGRPAHEVLRERVFEKAGMTSTLLSPKESLPDGMRLATGYSELLEGIVLDFSAVPVDTITTTGWTAGGVISTASEIADFGLAMMANKVVSGASRAEMEQLRGWPDDRDGWDYGLGTHVVEHRGVRGVGHTGGMPGYRSRLLYLPKLALSIALLTNSERGTMLDGALRLLDAAVD